MTCQSNTIPGDLTDLLKLPTWITSGRSEALEDVAFLSGAALAHLNLFMTRDEVPRALVRERLALRAAEACVVLSGRSERARELRDAVHLQRPGDRPGPAGEIYLHWRRTVERPVSVKSLHRALPMHGPEQIVTWLDGAGVGPIGRAVSALETVLLIFPRSETTALILADAVLAQQMRWTHAVPLLGFGLKRRDLGQSGDILRLACHRAVVASAAEAARLVSDLSRRSGQLRAVAPKLRAKGADDAVKMFLTRDAVAPAALPLPDRAARRLCDRLVGLGAVRELTGRDTFRLYGL